MQRIIISSNTYEVEKQRELADVCISLHHFTQLRLKMYAILKHNVCISRGEYIISSSLWDRIMNHLTAFLSRWNIFHIFTTRFQYFTMVISCHAKTRNSPFDCLYSLSQVWHVLTNWTKNNFWLWHIGFCFHPKLMWVHTRGKFEQYLVLMPS